MARGHVPCWAPSSSHSKMPTPAEKTLNMNLLQAHPLHGSLAFQFTSCLSNLWRCYDCLNIFGTFFCNKKIKKSPKISPITSLHRPSSRGRRLVSFALGEGLPRSQRASSRPSSTNWSSVYRVSRCASLAQGLGALGPWISLARLVPLFWKHIQSQLAKFSAELPHLDGIFLDTRLLLLFLILWKNRECRRFL